MISPAAINTVEFKEKAVVYQKVEQVEVSFAPEGNIKLARARLSAAIVDNALSNPLEIPQDADRTVQANQSPLAIADLLPLLRVAASSEQLEILEDQLKRLGPRSQLADIVRSADASHVRAAALQALVDTDPELTHKLLLAALSDREAQVRAVAAEAASDYLSDAPIVDAVRRLSVDDPSPIIRAIAADALQSG